MIIVTGTKRSGTSMWMQILKAAGYAIVGEAFPRDWAETIRAGNPLGFFESPLRRGIYYATNPDRARASTCCPLATQSLAVKVFVPGLLRTDLKFIHKVIATVRPWREYKGSVERLYRMEHRSREALRARQGASAPRELSEPRLITQRWPGGTRTTGLLRDAAMRRYPLHLVSYTRVLEQPRARDRRGPEVSRARAMPCAQQPRIRGDLASPECSMRCRARRAALESDREIQRALGSTRDASRSSTSSTRGSTSPCGSTRRSLRCSTARTRG